MLCNYNAWVTTPPLVILNDFIGGVLEKLYFYETGILKLLNTFRMGLTNTSAKLATDQSLTQFKEWATFCGIVIKN